MILAKPMSYMNLSGGPVTALRDFYKVPTANIVAIHDELDIDYGVLRLKLGGGDNGHNGLKSMTKAMGSDYHRVRFGIGRPPGRMQVADFVLKDFSSAERKELGYFVDRASDAVECLVIEGWSGRRARTTPERFSGAVPRLIFGAVDVHVQLPTCRPPEPTGVDRARSHGQGSPPCLPSPHIEAPVGAHIRRCGSGGSRRWVRSRR